MIAVGILAGCAGGKASVEDEPIEVSTDLKRDLWKGTQFLGDYEVGGHWVKGVVYHNPPKYRSFSFHAVAGTTIDIRVSSDGDAVAWLFDSKGKRIGYSDDADGTTDADAEKAYNEAVSGSQSLDRYHVANNQVPPAAQAAIDADVKSWTHGGVDEYALPSGSDTLYLVRGSVEEYAWFDLFDASGQFIVHGECGDGDLDVTAWGGAQGPHY